MPDTTQKYAEGLWIVRRGPDGAIAQIHESQFLTPGTSVFIRREMAEQDRRTRANIQDMLDDDE